MKKNFWVVFFSVASLHLLLLLGLGVCISGGCHHRQVLKNRTYIPSPEEEPEAVLKAPGKENIELVDIEDVATPIEPPKRPKINEYPPFPDFQIEQLTYTVKKGDSFWKIATKYGISMKELASYNDLSLKKPLKVGTVLRVPPGGEIEGAKSVIEGIKPIVEKKQPIVVKETKHQELPEDGTHIVKKGDSLWKIARMYDVKTKSIVDFNDLDVTKPLRVGQKLLIPGSGTIKSKPPIKTVDPVNSPVEKIEKKIDSHHVQTVEPVPTKKTVIDDVQLLKASTKDDISEEVINEITEAIGVTDDANVSDEEVNRLLEGNKDDKQSYCEHEVLEGETIEIIAKQYGTTPEKIRKFNPKLPRNGKLKPGSGIKIP